MKHFHKHDHDYKPESTVKEHLAIGAIIALIIVFFIGVTLFAYDINTDTTYTTQNGE